MLPFIGVRFQKFLCFLLIALFSSPVNGQLYKDPTLPVEDRVSDLLSKMTIEEKFWQVFMVPSDGEISDGKFKHGVFGLQVHATTGADSGGQMLKYDANHSARELAEKINSLQQYFRTQTRLGIPIIPFDEALHGLVRQGATVYQTVPPLLHPVEPQPKSAIGWISNDGAKCYVSVTHVVYGIVLTPLIHPEATDVSVKLSALINNLPDRRNRPVYVCVRSYQACLEPVLADLGAKAAARQAVMVKHLARLVKEGQTVPAVPSGVSIQPSRVSKVEAKKEKLRWGKS